MTEGIEYVYIETHNWGRTVKFWQELGFELELDLGRSGRLAHPGSGTAVFVEEVPEDRALAFQLYLHTPAETSPPATGEVVRDWHDSHWGTRLCELRDPDARTIVLQHGEASG